MSVHTAKQISLKEYLKEADENKVQIPEFQRDFVWSKSNMIKLASSLLKGYPIGSFLLMQNTQEYSKRVIEGVNINSNVNGKDCLLVLDGQQRTTTAYQILYGKGEFRFYFDYGKFIEILKDENIQSAKDEKLETIIEDSIEDLIIVFDLKNKKRPQSISEELSNKLFPLDIILQAPRGKNYSTWLGDYSFDKAGGNSAEFTFLNNISSIFTERLINNIISYQASQIIIDGSTSPNIVCTIFETINSTGIRLSIIDLLNAKCFPSGFELSKEILKTFEENPIFIDFDTEDKNEFIGLSIIKIIGLLSKKRSCKKSDLLSLDAQTIKQNWENAVNYLVNFLEFAKAHFGTIGIKFLPYKDMFVPLAVIIGDGKFDKQNADHVKKVEKWYWTCAFTGYFDNATESKSASTVKEFLGDSNNLGWLDNDNQIPTLIENSKMLYTSEFNEIDNAASQQSAIYKAILNLIILNEACDFQGNKKLIKDLKESDLQDHHIFPKKFLASQNPKIEKNEANTILNRTLISTIANQAIKDKQPSIYFQDNQLFKGNLLDEKDLARHFINEEFTNQKYAKGNFSKQNYDDFKKERKRQIIEIIKSKIA